MAGIYLYIYSSDFKYMHIYAFYFETFHYNR